MHKLIKKMVLVLILVLVFTIVSSCQSEEPVDDKIYLEDIILKPRPDGYYQVVGLTEKGEQTKNIIFPSHYNGIPIIGVGIAEECNFYFQCDIIENDYKSYDSSLSFDISNVETIYFASHHTNWGIFANSKDNLKKCVYMSVLHFNEKNTPNIPPNWSTTIFLSHTNMNYVNVLYRNEYESLKEGMSRYFREENNIVIANIEFYYNKTETDEDLYWIDYEKEATLIFEPPVPYREGYEFEGWYKEKECINVWDFNKDMIAASIDLENMVELKLYAKWSEK